MHRTINADKVKKHLVQKTKEIEHRICILGIYLQVDRKFRKTEERLYKKVKTRLRHELIRMFLNKKGVKTNDQFRV